MDVQHGEAVLMEELGFAAEERVLVLHVDDIGLCAAANEGALAALAGSATCGSIMAPCSGFEDLLRRLDRHPGAAELDLGVHLTVNCEQERVPWGPLRDDVPSLLDSRGALWSSKAEVVANAGVEEVERELRAQVDRVLAAGVDVTHLDSHMGTLFDLKFVDVYFRLARDYRLPVFVPRIRRELLLSHDLPDEFERYVELIEEAESMGFPIFDHFDSNSLHFEPGQGLAHNRARLGSLGPGLTYFITHCARGDEELRHVTMDWRVRDEECRIFSDGSAEVILREEGFRRIGMRPLRDRLRRHLDL